MEGIVEPFSSQGPTNSGESKPDLVAPDCVRTASYEGVLSAPICGADGLFAGTSAAAPHVAGAAALLLSEDPELEPEALKQILIEQAQPVPGASPNQVGAGQLSLGIGRGPDLVIESAERVGDEPLKPGQQVEIAVWLKNQGEEDSSPFWVTIWLKGEEYQLGKELSSRRVSPGLAAGEEREVHLKWELTEESAAAAEDNELKAVVVVDAFDDVTETDEDNNQFELTLALAQPELAVQPQSLGFHGQEGGEAPPAQSLTIANVGVGQLEWRAKVDQEWITLSRTSGTLEAGQTTDIEVTVELNELSAGTYEGEITIIAEGVLGSPAHIPVTLIVEPPPAVLEVSPQELEFQAQEGEDNPDPRTFTIHNAGGQPLSWLASVSESWLNVSPSEGVVAPGEDTIIQVNVDITGLSAGTYHAEIEITSPDAQNSPQHVAVTLKVAPRPAMLQVSPTSLSFSAREGGDNPSPKSVSVSNVGGQPLEWYITTDADWILPGMSGGTLDQGESFELLVFINIQGLSAGVYHGTVMINAPGAKGSPVRVEVTLTLSSP